MNLMSPVESMMLLAESPGHPMHVAGLQLFAPPPDAGPEFVREYYEALRACDGVRPLFRKHPATLPGGLNVGWSSATDIELDYHVRHSALPRPGRVRELLELTSRLHSGMLDRHRPLWETHVIEGLNDGRFAVYTKIHHGLVDGIAAINLLQAALSADALDQDVRAPWALSPSDTDSPPDTSTPLRTLARTVTSIPRLGASTLGLARSALLEQQLTLPFRAPSTMLNVPIGGARRCAAQSWSLQRIKDVKNAAGVTVNDVVLAMCAGALRAYLTDQNALPEKPLIAMVPVSLRTAQDAAGGNAASAVLANLATHIDDPAQRLATISASMKKSKAVMAALPRPQAIALGMALLSPVVLGGVTGSAIKPPPFNVCISNVPGSRNTLYAKGARLRASYPMSIAAHGQPLNITLVGSGDSLDFGLVGCRRAVPHLQRLLAHLETSLKDLELAAGI